MSFMWTGFIKDKTGENERNDNISMISILKFFNECFL